MNWVFYLVKMGNFPLCIPKQDGIVFRDCPSNSSDFILHHHFQMDNSDEVKNEGRTEVEGAGGGGGAGGDSVRGTQGDDDAAVLGIEIDQDSVRVALYLHNA